jgi:hypothetical protein
MNLSPRAANQFQAIDPNHVVAIVNALRERSFKPGATIVQVPAGGMLWRCFVARHTNGQQGSWIQTKAMEGDRDDDGARTIATAEMHRDEQAVR